MRISDWSSDVCSSDLFKATDAAEEIQLVGGDAQADRVLAAGRRVRPHRQVGRQALTRGAAVGTQRWQAIGALDAVLRTIGLHTQRGCTQIAVVVERGANQRLQFGRTEEGLPAQAVRIGTRGGSGVLACALA